LRALQPAKVKEVRLDDQTGTATVIVHDFQLSLAIGKEGQTRPPRRPPDGWRVDIKSETQLAEEEAAYAGEEWAEGEWVQNESGDLVLAARRGWRGGLGRGVVPRGVARSRRGQSGRGRRRRWCRRAR